MSEAFISELRIVSFNFPPKGWAFCNGQLLPINQNQALFSLLGTMYGGNGQTTFALPNLQSRVPMHFGTFAGNSYSQGEEAGEETITLSINEMPAHSHTFSGTTSDANFQRPVDGAALAKVHHQGGTTPDFYYAPDTTPQPINLSSVTPYGANQAHTNLQPYLTISWCIAMSGIFPARN